MEVRRKVTRIYKETRNCDKKVVVNVGGARSSKSHSIIQHFLELATIGKSCMFGICRKTMPALKMSTMKKFFEVLDEYGIYNRKYHNKTENYYILNGNRLQFFSLDQPDRIKSTEFSAIWMEEANEFTYRDYITLLTRLSGKEVPGFRNRLFMSLNPDDADGYVAKKISARKDAHIIYSTYKDNPFLNKEYIEELENLKDIDPDYYRIYALGKWGQMRHKIYSNYTFVDDIPLHWDNAQYGLDFGYNNPSCLIKVYWRDRIPYIKQEIYKTHLTTEDLIEEMKRRIPMSHRGFYMYADSAEPDRIQTIARAGFNIHPAVKDVNAGIDTVKSFNLHILKDSLETIKEIQSYKWKLDKNDQPLDSPLEYNDHAMDAIRYAIHSHLKKMGNLPRITTA